MVIIFSVFFKKTFKSQVNYEYFVSIVMVVIRTNKNSNKNIYKKKQYCLKRTTEMWLKRYKVETQFSGFS